MPTECHIKFICPHWVIIHSSLNPHWANNLLSPQSQMGIINLSFVLTGSLSLHPSVFTGSLGFYCHSACLVSSIHPFVFTRSSPEHPSVFIRSSSDHPSVVTGSLSFNYLSHHWISSMHPSCIVISR